MYNDSSLSFFEKDNNTVIISMPPLVYKTVQSSVIAASENNSTTENVKNFIVTLPTKVMNLDGINTTGIMDSTMKIIGNMSDVKIETDIRKVEINSINHFGVISIVIVCLLYIFFLSYYLRQRFCKANNRRRRHDDTV